MSQIVLDVELIIFASKFSLMMQNSNDNTSNKCLLWFKAEAAAMIAQDQEEFEKTHRLLQVSNDLKTNRITPIYLQITIFVSTLQAEKTDILNASELANSSWKSAGSCILPKMSDVSKDASYLRLSLGEFFGQRSEALGCLGGGSDVKRVCISVL